MVAFWIIKMDDLHICQTEKQILGMLSEQL